MNAAVNSLYTEYLDHTGGDKAAAASLTLAAVLTEAGAVMPAPAGQSLTVKEAAAQLHVSTSCIYELCESGRLASFKVGRVLRIHPEAIEDYRRQGAVPCRREPFSGRPNRCL
jgi:excisionase family DNA binding protein